MQQSICVYLNNNNYYNKRIETDNIKVMFCTIITIITIIIIAHTKCIFKQTDSRCVKNDM